MLVYPVLFSPLTFVNHGIRFFATGSSDGLVSLYDIEEYLCVRMFGRLEQPVRTIGFSYDGELIAAGSEDPFIDISIVETGEPVCIRPFCLYFSF